MKYCQKCILPETYPGITFNEEGICNYCLEYKPEINVKGQESLVQVIRSHPNPGPYDCIVPVSGGKDSSFILYYIVKELKLKPLALSYNSGFQHPIAEENVRNACKILGVDLKEIHSPGKIQEKILKSSSIISKKTGMIWGCANCPAILRMLPIIVARKLKIPFVIWGSSVLEEVKVKSIKTTSNGKIKVLLKNPSVIFHGFRYVFLRALQRLRLGFPLKFALRPFSIPPFTTENPKFIHFYDYVPWDSMKHVNLMAKEINWKHPAGKDSRFDCTLNCIGNVFFYDSYGISKDGLNYCTFVRQGKMSREDAFNKEQDLEKLAKDEFSVLLEKIK